MIQTVASGEFEDDDKLYFGTVPDGIADRILNLTGTDPHGFRMAIEARQIHHILNDHGKNGGADHSMSDPADLARLEYVLWNPDEIRSPSKTRAYLHFKRGKNRPADTVLYDKRIGEKSYYVVQAVPDTKAKTLYVVTAFIGDAGYKKEAPQFNDANGLVATAKTEHAGASSASVSQTSPTVNPQSTDGRKFSVRDSEGREPDFTMSDSVDFTMTEAPVTEGTEETPTEDKPKEKKPLHNLTRIVRAIKPIAERIMEKAGAKGNTGELRQLIEQAYADIARKRNPTMEDIQAAAEPAAQWVMEHTPAQLDPYAEAALAEMKGRTVKLNDGQRAEIVSQYGSIAAFKKALGSAVKISEEGLPLDVFFQEMAESFPGLFDQTVSDAQMGPRQSLSVPPGKIISGLCLCCITIHAELPQIQGLSRIR